MFLSTLPYVPFLGAWLAGIFSILGYKIIWLTRIIDQMYAYFKQAKQDPTFENAPTPGVFDFKVRATIAQRCW